MPLANAATHHRHRKKTPADADAAPSPTPGVEAKAPASQPTPAPPDSTGAKPKTTSTISPQEITGFDQQPESVRKILSAALELTKQNLPYIYGSADPANGGMDCSGTMYYLLKSAGLQDVPRQANEQYVWVRKESTFHAVLSRHEDTFELDEMKPGDLLFWTGTYVTDRDPPVTHTMMYLGRRAKDGKRLMVGASDGRTYDGERRNGVSIFDFKLPPEPAAPKSTGGEAPVPTPPPTFAGYGTIPGLAVQSPSKSAPSPSAHNRP